MLKLPKQITPNKLTFQLPIYAVWMRLVMRIFKNLVLERRDSTL